MKKVIAALAAAILTGCASAPQERSAKQEIEMLDQKIIYLERSSPTNQGLTQEEYLQKKKYLLLKKKKFILREKLKYATPINDLVEWLENKVNSDVPETFPGPYRYVDEKENYYIGIDYYYEDSEDSDYIEAEKGTADLQASLYAIYSALGYTKADEGNYPDIDNLHVSGLRKLLEKSYSEQRMGVVIYGISRKDAEWLRRSSKSATY